MSIDLECITTDLQSEINMRSEVKSIRNCVDCDENIDVENNNVQHLKKKCDGRMTTTATYDDAPWLLTVLSSRNHGSKLLFFDIP